VIKMSQINLGILHFKETKYHRLPKQVFGQFSETFSKAYGKYVAVRRVSLNVGGGTISGGQSHIRVFLLTHKIIFPILTPSKREFLSNS
jgi:hypothetical protein